MERMLLFSLILSISYRWSSASPTRVVGGFEAPPVFGRYQASLQNLTGSHVCGGAVVSDRHVVTAAHCVTGADPMYIKIVVGTSDLDIGGEQYDVESIEIHKDFNFGSKANDIAIVKTVQSFDRKNVEILKLGSNELVDGDTVTLTGFGAIEGTNGESSRRLHILNLNVFSQDTCQYAMRYTREVSDTMFCTFNRIGQGTCHGDSGSPLVMEGQLVGLVSWGIPCAMGFPDVHTRTILYNGWIQNEINKHADPMYIKIVVGTSDLDIGGEQYDVESIEIHKDFNFGSKANDIAIVKTVQSFDRKNVEILKLGSNELVDGDTVTLTGFGAIEGTNGESSRRLHILNLNVFSQDTCQYAMRYTREVSDTMFCTFNRIGQGTCHGDSGSPLVMEGQLVGLVSWGIPCAMGFPDVHTRTILYNGWIQNEINKQ